MKSMKKKKSDIFSYACPKKGTERKRKSNIAYQADKKVAACLQAIYNVSEAMTDMEKLACQTKLLQV